MKTCLLHVWKKITIQIFCPLPLDYAQHEQQQQQHHHQQQQQQQPQPGYGNSFEPEDDEKITVSYYDQQGVMQTYTYGQGRKTFWLYFFSMKLIVNSRNPIWWEVNDKTAWGIRFYVPLKYKRL